MNLKKQLYDLLYSNWSLTGDLIKKKVDFGRHSKVPQQIVKPQVVIGNFTDVIVPLGSSTDNFLEGKAKGTVSLQVKAKDKTQEKKVEAEDLLDLMEEEVKRIVAKSTKPSDWDSAYVESGEILDPEGDPPLLQEIVKVFVYYIRTF